MLKSKIFIIIAIIILAAGAVYFWQKDAINKLFTGKNNGEACIQVITPAKNSITGECKEFPTPCDIPEGWEKVESCPASVVDTTDWKTYWNEGYGFEVKYPLNWEWEKSQLYESQGLQLNQMSASSKIVFLKSKPKDNETGRSVSFSELVAREKESVQKIKKDDLSNKEIISFAIKDITDEQIMVGGTSSVQLSYFVYVNTENFNQAQHTIRIFIPTKNGEVFQIAFYGNDYQPDESESDFNQILSTFKFIK